MQVTTMMADELGKYLDLSAQQAKLTAQNMANVDTPGYRAVGFDFASEMSRALGEMESGTCGMNPSFVRVLPEDGLVSRPDGNNVSIDRESLTLAEAQLRFRTGVTLLTHEFMMLHDAIKADDGSSRGRA